MSQESMQVLKMLAEGKLSVEQAHQLLDALGEHPTVVAEPFQIASSAPQQAAGSTTDQFTFTQIMQMGIVGVEPEFIQHARELGLSDLTFDQIVHMGMVGVEPEFFLRTRTANLDLTFDQIMQMGVVGVEPEFFHEVHEAGLMDLSFDQIVHMGAIGVDPMFVKKARMHSVL